MGYETDTFTLATGLACTGAATPGVCTVGTVTMPSSDFQRGVLRIKFAAITTAPTSLFVFLQNQDVASGGATDWYPNPAAVASPNFVAALAAKDPNNPLICGGQVQLAATPATTDRYSIPLDTPAFPGNLARLAVLAIGASASFTLTVTADMQKWVADFS
jgi:hypothetical protein